MTRAAFVLASLSLSSFALLGCTQDFSRFDPSGGGAGGAGGVSNGGGGTGNVGGMTGGGGVGNTGGGGEGPCQGPQSCPVPADPCMAPTCTNGVCGEIAIAEGEQCSSGMGVCSAAGACVECLDQADCLDPNLPICLQNFCVSAACEDGELNGTETDVDCGGPACLPCPNNDDCMVGSDCQSGFCDGGSCNDCDTNADCDAADYCNGAVDMGTCEPKLGNGLVCDEDGDCSSGECVEGVCCDGACNDTCVSCLAQFNGGVDGTCGNVVAGEDPHGDCESTSSNCEANDCSGTGPTCGLKAPGASCGAAECQGGDSVLDQCDAAGVCQQNAQTVDCGAFICQANGSCAASCTVGANTGCANGFYCAGGNQCLPKKDNGEGCAGGGECTSTFCFNKFDGNPNNGVCCNEQCGGNCRTCLMMHGASADGTCGNVTVDSDPYGECPGGNDCAAGGQCE